MPKRVFWPVALIIMGLVFLASNVGLLPRAFWDLWPLILIVVGLGGLLTSDREEWMVDTSQYKEKPASSTTKPAKSASTKKKKSTKK